MPLKMSLGLPQHECAFFRAYLPVCVRMKETQLPVRVRLDDRLRRVDHRGGSHPGYARPGCRAPVYVSGGR